MPDNRSSLSKNWWFLVGTLFGILGGVGIWLLHKERRQIEGSPNQGASKHDRHEILLEGPESIPIEDVLPGEISAEAPFEVSRLSRPYLEAVVSNLDACSKEWQESVWVRFGTTGKGLRPNYQIENESGEKCSTFNGNTHARRASPQRLRAENLTPRRYSRQELLANF